MACGHIPRVSAHLHMAIPLCVFLRFLSLRRTPVSELKAHPDNPGSPHLKTHLQSRSRLDTSTRIWGATVHPTTLALAFFLIAHLLRAHSPLGPMGKAQHDPHEADGQTEAPHAQSLNLLSLGRAQGPTSHLEEAQDSHTHASRRRPTGDDSPPTPPLHRPRSGSSAGWGWGRGGAGKGRGRGRTQTSECQFAPVSNGSKSHLLKDERGSWKESLCPLKITNPLIPSRGQAHTAAHPASHSAQKGPIMTSQARNYVISLGRRQDPGTKGSLSCKSMTGVGSGARGQPLLPSSFRAMLTNQLPAF